MFCISKLERNSRVTIHRLEKDGDWKHLPIILSVKTRRKASNLAYTMLLVQGRISPKMWLCVCLLAVLVSQGIVVKCTTAIFFRMVD